MVLLFLAWPSLSMAQGPVRAQIEVPPLIIAEPAAETPLAIRVGPPAALPPSSFLRVRGLAPGMTLSDGHVVASGVWAVPLFALATLKVVVPAGQSGRSNLLLSLVTVEGAAVSEARSAIVVANLAIQARREAPIRPTTPDDNDPGLAAAPPPVPAGRPDRTAVVQIPALAQPIAPTPGVPPRQRAARPDPVLDGMVAEGLKARDLGRLTVARAFFQRAADLGDMAGAARLAETYDADALVRHGFKASAADPSLARRWYALAAERGDAAALVRLRQLDGR
jgi:hypothetical protein